ncbi:glutamate synthase subunit beta [Luteococcus sp. Sow4_B9]|uniref:glutamate synthase subunit beta n=1 Tax=Luteococcus sp. Sow4_B9 TaxID=3438792 RepID=UPI003F98C774
MADPRGFITRQRQLAERRPVEERLGDWQEVYPGTPGRALLPIISQQASRCMDCGIPSCHNGCPLGNLIPEWNDLVWRDEWPAALERLHATNNFPEFTGRLCPAPCETACVVGISREPVTIKNVEVSIIDKAWDDLRVVPQQPQWHSLKTVAVVGSGPAGLAAAQQLTRAGHTVVVYERADAIGGLLRYGIPEFKMEKRVIDRRLKQMVLEGTVFKTDTPTGPGADEQGGITGEQLLERFDAVVLTIGSRVPRALQVPGSDLEGIHQAMDYLTQATQRLATAEPVEAREPAEGQIHAKGKHVVVIGGGDTSNDCLGTALRQGAASVTQLEIMPQPPQSRPEHQPWPTYPMIYRIASANEEGGERLYAVNTSEFLGEDGHVTGLRLSEVRFEDGKLVTVEGTERELKADLVLQAMGFLHPEGDGVVAELGLELDERGNIRRGDDYQTNVPGLFAAGDCGRGQSLIVWAIAEGRGAAHGVDAFLRGTASRLPRPIGPQERQLMA